MKLFRYFPTVMKLLLDNDWKELAYRIRLRVKGIDLTLVEVTELGLSPEHSKRHASSGSPELKGILKSFDILPNDSLIDIGCGKGGALIEFSKLQFSRLAGVDISPRLIEIARCNLAKLKITNVDLLCSDATTFSDFDPYTFIYFYNPFPCKVMSTVIENVIASLTRSPRKMTIIYHTPACHSEIIEKNVFVKIGELYDRRRNNKIFIYTNRK